jgi:hypothetical protein
VHDELLTSVAREVATHLPHVYATKRRRNLAEMFHLQPETTAVVERFAPRLRPTPTLTPKKLVELLGWVGVGGVDTVFNWPDGRRTFLELKAGDDLSACAWDAVKLSAFVLNGSADAGYMLAAAPTASWGKPVPGADLFANDQWETMGPRIRDAHSKWWYRWQEETVSHPKWGLKPNRHFPGLVAKTFRTIALGSFPFEVAGVSWDLRLVRVDPSGSDWDVWKCVPAP